MKGALGSIEIFPNGKKNIIYELFGFTTGPRIAGVLAKIASN